MYLYGNSTQQGTAVQNRGILIIHVVTSSCDGALTCKHVTVFWIQGVGGASVEMNHMLVYILPQLSTL